MKLEHDRKGSGAESPKPRTMSTFRTPRGLRKTCFVVCCDVQVGHTNFVGSDVQAGHTCFDVHGDVQVEVDMNLVVQLDIYLDESALHVLRRGTGYDGTETLCTETL